MECETCEGRGFKELEHGMIMMACDDCEGTGEVANESWSDEKVSISGGIPEGAETPGSVFQQTTTDADVLTEEILNRIRDLPNVEEIDLGTVTGGEGVLYASTNRTGQSDSGNRSANPGKPKQRRKSKATGKARKRAG